MSTRFWPLDWYDAVCADSFIPEVWLSPVAEQMDPNASPPYSMVGFVAGERASRVGKLPHAEIARQMLSQLDAMFGTSEAPHPASSSCEGFLVKEWAGHEFTHGAYSHPTLGGERQALGEGVHGCIWLAGEACHPGINPCVHGAIETGESAASRCMASLAPHSRM